MSNLVIPDGGTIGSTSDTDAISISSTGKVTTADSELNVKAENSGTTHTFTVKGVGEDILEDDGTTVVDADSGQFAVYNGSTKLLGITEHGYVLEPNTPFARFHFQSNDPGAYDNGGSKVAIPSGVTINRGSHYDTSNGRFTCPVSGDYECCFTGNYYKVNAGTNVKPGWHKNGSEVARYYNSVTSDTDTWMQICGYIVISCSAGDYLQLYNQTQTGNGGGWDLGIYSNVTFRLIG